MESWPWPGRRNGLVAFAVGLGVSHERDIDRAVAELGAGNLVAVPTETVYGLAGDATNPDAVRKIFAAKGRPAGHPLIAHLADVSWLERWCAHPPAAAFELGLAFWPGPLTIILHRGPEVPAEVTGGLATLAVRVPRHEVTREIIRRLGRPIAAPSANRFGAVSPTTAEHVRRDLGDPVAFIIDGGACDVGVESTILDLTGEDPVIARPGGISAADLESVLGRPVGVSSTGAIKASGTLPSHYSPNAEVVLVGSSQLAAAANHYARQGHRVGILSPGGLELDDSVNEAPFSNEPETAARQLYAGLRLLDAQGCEIIVAALPPEEGIGVAIADRLRRAAHKD